MENRACVSLFKKPRSYLCLIPLFQMKALLGPLPPQLLRGSCRPGMSALSAGAPAAAHEPDQAADVRAAHGQELAAAAGSSSGHRLRPRSGSIGEAWHERLSPLGLELTKVILPYCFRVLFLPAGTLCLPSTACKRRI